jgi:hypothetical protein
MLRRRFSETPLVAGLVEHQCPRCHRPVELPFGTVCGPCRQEVERRARRLGHLVALITTVALAVYVVLRLPPDPRARMMSGLAVAVWYVLVKLVVERSAKELLP